MKPAGDAVMAASDETAEQAMRCATRESSMRRSAVQCSAYLSRAAAKDERRRTARTSESSTRRGRGCVQAREGCEGMAVIGAGSGVGVSGLE